MSIAGIAILLIILAFALMGMKKGLVRKISGILSVIISCALVQFLLPYVSQALKEQTPVYGFIADRCADVVSTQVRGLLPENILAQYGAGEGEAMGQSGMGVLANLTRTQQTTLIRSMPVPEFLQKMMESYNNSEGYRKLQATDFAQYLVRFIADLIMNVLAFLVTMAVTWLIVRAVIGSLHLFSRLPLLGAADRIGGLICGALQGIFTVWFILLVLSLLSGTQAGMAVQDQIDRSLALWPITESNIFLKIITNAVSKML